MIEMTAKERSPLIAPENLLVVTNCAHVDLVRDLLPIPPENVIGEPEGRDTAPCVALATAMVRRRDPGATMALLAADAWITPAELFQKTLSDAAKAAQSGALVTLGIRPGHPATGYGYLRLAEEVAPGFHRVAEFREKPDAATAEAFVRDGRYRWNSGIFVWRCDAISRAFADLAPDLSEKLEAWSRGADHERDFASCRRISIDYAVMEKADHVIAADAKFDWRDIGSRDGLRALLPADECNNAVRGNAVCVDASRNLVFGDDETMIGVIGMHGVAVVKSGNGVLVCPLAEEQRIRELVKRIAEKDESFL